MLQLIKTFWQICLLRQGPQDVPYSLPTLATILIINYGVASIGVVKLFGLAQGLWFTALPLLVTLGAIYVALWLRKHQTRFVQTCSASFGINLLLGLMAALGLLIILLLLGGPTANAAKMASTLLVMGMLAWSLVVSAYVYKQALEVPWVAAILFTIMLELLRFVVFRGMIQATVS